MRIPDDLGLRPVGVVTLLILSAVTLLLAPLALPPSYSSLSQTTSEAAAQGLQGAWAARLGFLLFGWAVIWVASFARTTWGRWGAWLLGAFGFFMVAAAVFSNRPWLPGVPSDSFEDFLHSAASTAMGFAFAGGLVAVGIGRRLPSGLDRAFDLLALAASVLLPIGMSVSTQYAGFLQRSMFLIAMAWFSREALRSGQIERRVRQ